MKIEIKNDYYSTPNAPVGFKVGVQTDNPHDADWTLLAVGDIGLSGKIGMTAQKLGSASGLFGEVPKAFENADIVFANLETPLINDWGPECMFAGNSKWATDLRGIGIDIANLASNHMYDYGAKGFENTIRVVQDSGITIIGAGDSPDQARKLTVKEVKGNRIGFLAAGHTNIKQSKNGPFLWELEIDELVETVSKHRSQVDCLIVSIHWGPMLVDYPYMQQYKGAHRLVDAGASAVLMHHAHILQGVEVYKESPICYGMGNFTFDPTEGQYQTKASNFKHLKYEDQLTSGVFRFKWKKGQFLELTVAPISLPRPENFETDAFQMKWSPPDIGERVLSRLQQISEDLNGDFSSKLEKQLWAARNRTIRMDIDIILKRGDLGRLCYLVKRVKFRHVLQLLKRIGFIIAGFIRKPFDSKK